MQIVDPDENYFESLNSQRESQGKCEYFTVSEFNKNFMNENVIFNYNIRSFNSNSDSLFCLFQNVSTFPQILVLTETWFKPKNCQTIQGYEGFHTTRTDQRSGGVSIYLKNHIPSCLIPELSFINSSIEVCTVKLKTQNIPIVVIGIYRPNRGLVGEFSEHLATIFSHSKLRNCKIVVLGDFNINILCAGDRYVELFMNTMQSFNLLPIITKPTRIPETNTNPSLLDQIWISSTMNYTSCGIIYHDMTDHLPVFCSFKSLNLPKNDRGQKIKITFREENPVNRDKFTQKLSNFDWNTIKSADPNTYAKNFINTLNELYCISFPIRVKYVTQRYFDTPWITPEIFKLIQNKSTFYYLFKEGLITKEDNNFFKNRVQNIIRVAKKNYYKRAFEQSRGDLQRSWDLIKSLTGVQTARKKLECIIHNGIRYTTDETIANAFNDYFISIPHNLDNLLPESSVDPLSYLSVSAPNSF